MHFDEGWGRKLFVLINYLFLGLLAVLCLFPMIHVLALSLSSSAAAAGGEVKLWPVDFTWKSYEYALTKPEFVRSLWVSVRRVFLGTIFNLVLTVLCAYPLAKEHRQFRWRTFYAWFFVFTTLFHGGLIPTYMVVKDTKLLDSIWALIIPGAVPVFNVILLLNFFRSLPRELEEAAYVDGAGHLTTLFKIFLPLSLPAIATITLFTAVGHWNSWFDGLIYMNSPDKYPLQSYLQTIIIQTDYSSISEDQVKNLALISDRTIKASQLFLGALPILLVYPFLQRYFMKGIVLGSVKE